MNFKPQTNLQNSRILITNDDGIEAYGIKLLEKILLNLTPNVYVVAPNTEKSGAGHSITTNKQKSQLGHTTTTGLSNDIKKYDDKHYAIDGTPTDCIRAALNIIMPNNYPDLIISGINNGRNIADDITYSGTIGAAIEGILYGIPSIAVSQLTDGSSQVNWQMAEKYLLNIITKVRQGSFSADTFININFPNVSFENLKGIKICPQGSRRFVEGTIENKHLCTYTLTTVPAENKDIKDHTAIKDSITITPLKINLTDKEGIKELEKLFA